MIGLLVSASVAHVSVALGASISNRDERDYTVTIIEGGAKADHALKPAQTLSDVCLKGCTMRVNGSQDSDYILAGGDTVSIEDGTVFYDRAEPSPANAASPAPGKRPSRKG
ncbi:MAG TPA: hypothetical protein VFZ16_06260 [Hyphomicrobiaceae bacterium]|nr:hypothetical protein [Hyphomicrobiaceae bacterium]